MTNTINNAVKNEIRDAMIACGWDIGGKEYDNSAAGYIRRDHNGPCEAVIEWEWRVRADDTAVDVIVGNDCVQMDEVVFKTFAITDQPIAEMAQEMDTWFCENVQPAGVG